MNRAQERAQDFLRPTKRVRTHGPSPRTALALSSQELPWAKSDKLLGSEGPPVSVWRIDIRVRFGHIGYGHVRAIPIQFLARANSDVTEQDDLGQRSRHVEIGACGFASLAGVDPLLVRAG